jgi:hypothetical protein
MRNEPAARIRPKSRPNRDACAGAVLFFAVALIAFVGLLGFTSYTLSSMDFQITRNQTGATRAFAAADGGIRYVKSELENRLAAGAELVDLQTSFQVTPPPGMNFDTVNSIEQLPNTNLYTYTVTGRDGAASATIEAVVRQANAMELGIFGNLQLNFSPNVDVYSYRSDVISNPTPADSTGNVVVGSNLELIIQPNVSVDGYYIIGTDESGNVGTYPLGQPVEEVDRIDPDPLGVVGGAAATYFTAVRDSNDNNSASFINGTSLRIWNDAGTLGPGVYYLTDAVVKGDLTVDTAGGPVTIFMEGPFDTKPGTNINVTGNPTDFRVFSNSPDTIFFQPNNALRMFLYAPYAEVLIWPNAGFYGVVWGRNVDLHPGGDVYIDMSMLERIKSNRVLLVAWKELRN